MQARGLTRGTVANLLRSTGHVLPTRWVKPKLSALVKAQVRAAIAARARTVVFFPDVAPLPSINYTITRQLAGGEAF